ncbi:MAG: sulfatase-like hydrolase/transferase, partial [Chitinivibrionales bacterium]|nr:sulfatase-like hydrolase/transferase [Chitinivibrionales bacterium]
MPVQSAAPDAKAAKPNILFIMADQFRHDYMGCAGAAWVDTPNIDRIARERM